MVSGRVQEYARNVPHRRSVTGSRSSSAYLSADNGYMSEVDEDQHYSDSGSSKWKKRQKSSISVSSIDSSSNSGAARKFQPILDWRKRTFKPDNNSSAANADKPTDVPGHGEISQEWYTNLNVHDDLSLEEAAPLERRNRRFDTEPLEEDVMRPVPARLTDSNQDLAEAMARLNTTTQMTQDDFEARTRDPTNMEPSQLSAADLERPAASGKHRESSPMDTWENESIYRVSPEPLRIPVERDKLAISPLAWKALVGKMHDLTRSVGAFTATMEDMRGELSSATAKLQNLEHQQHRKAGRKKPYTVPQRRPQDAKNRAHTVRKEIDALLNAHAGDPFVSKEEADRFSKSQERFPGLRCCDSDSFRLDLNGGIRSPWNRSLELIFMERYTERHIVPEHDTALVSQAFYTRLKSIKASRTVTESQKATKATYVRKYGLFQRRFEALAQSVALQGYLPLLQGLSIEGMSSDEEEELDVQIPSTAAHPRNPRYHVLCPRWRGKELTSFLHLVDSIYLLQRRTDGTKQRGNWARVRLHNANNPKFSKKTSFPKNLPENAYDKEWLKEFPNVNLSVNPAPRCDFALTPETLQFLLAPRVAHST